MTVREDWNLTPRETAIVELLVLGFTDQSIATQLGISLKTEKELLYRARAKMGLPLHGMGMNVRVLMTRMLILDEDR
jgi:DNA-binding CsgD family transcriptional regulator